MEMTMTLKASWKESLLQNLSLPTSLTNNELPRVAIVGIGNEFNGDDAVGVWVARRLEAREFSVDAGHVLVIEAGQAPENITGLLRRFMPQVVLLIDAAQMNAAPGHVAWIPWETTTGLSASSHSLPLSMMARYLVLEFSCSVFLLGIQPAQNQPNAGLSPLAQAAVEDICQTLIETLFVPER